MHVHVFVCTITLTRTFQLHKPIQYTCTYLMVSCAKNYTHTHAHTLSNMARSNEMKFTQKSGETFQLSLIHIVLRALNVRKTRKQNLLFHITTTYFSMNLLRFTLLFNSSFFFFLNMFVWHSFHSLFSVVIEISITMELFFFPSFFRIAIFNLNNFT